MKLLVEVVVVGLLGSPPARGRGLKRPTRLAQSATNRRPPRGGVD